METKPALDIDNLRRLHIQEVPVYHVSSAQIGNQYQRLSEAREFCSYPGCLSRIVSLPCADSYHNGYLTHLGDCAKSSNQSLNSELLLPTFSRAFLSRYYHGI